MLLQFWRQKKLQANLGSEESKHRDSPESQIYGYLKDAYKITKNIRWGILTNGRFWRLYYRDASEPSEKFFEIDLFAILGMEVGEQQSSKFELFVDNKEKAPL